MTNIELVTSWMDDHIRPIMLITKEAVKIFIRVNIFSILAIHFGPIFKINWVTFNFHKIFCCTFLTIEWVTIDWMNAIAEGAFKKRGNIFSFSSCVLQQTIIHFHFHFNTAYIAQALVNHICQVTGYQLQMYKNLTWFTASDTPSPCEVVFQVPMPGDSGSCPDAGSISNYCLNQENFHSNLRPLHCLFFFSKMITIWIFNTPIFVLLTYVLKKNSNKKSS